MSGNGKALCFESETHTRYVVTLLASSVWAGKSSKLEKFGASF